MKILILAAIRCSLMFTAVTASVFSIRPAQANYIVTLQQVGPNVVATGSGTIDVNSLVFLGSLNQIPAGMRPSNGSISTGTTANVDIYFPNDGPLSFGSGVTTFASSSSGDIVGAGDGLLLVPEGYISGNPLTDRSTYNNATFASLGVTPGTYVWSGGFTLIIGGTAVPDGGSTVSLLGCALLGLAALRRKLS
jgi:VPDSG-CTERM motif